jgi:5-methylcytosine-specific restriction protein A
MQINEKSLAEVLTARFRLALSGCVVQAATGVRYGVRATDISEPNGFAVVVSTGWKSLDADFFPDTYAGELVRAMGQKASEDNQPFMSLARSFEELGNRINLRINGSVVNLKNGLPAPPWSRFELNVHKLTDAVSGDEASLLAGVENIVSTCLALILTLLPIEEDEVTATPMFEAGLPEGACRTVLANRYERNPVNRAACIAAHGFRCKICGFDFGAYYGPIANGYIEVHHRVPVAKMVPSYHIDPVNDLMPVCANCHATVHRTDPPIEPETLAALLEERHHKVTDA